MITVYSFPTCPYCNEMKSLLVSEGINFRDVNIDLPENDEEFNKIMEIANADEVPIIRVGKQLLVPNKSFHSIQEGFELTKKLLA
jgi:glutaredoxin